MKLYKVILGTSATQSIYYIVGDDLNGVYNKAFEMAESTCKGVMVHLKTIELLADSDVNSLPSLIV